MTEQEPEYKGVINWKDFYSSGMKRGVPTRPTKEMLLVHINEQTGVPDYTGTLIRTGYTDGRGDYAVKQTFDVLYDPEYVKEYLHSLFSDIGLIANGNINTLLWNKWLSIEGGEIAEYHGTEGIRQQLEKDRTEAKRMADQYTGTTVEYWLEIIQKAKAQSITTETEPAPKASPKSTKK